MCSHYNSVTWPIIGTDFGHTGVTHDYISLPEAHDQINAMLLLGWWAARCQTCQGTRKMEAKHNVVPSERPKNCYSHTSMYRVIRPLFCLLNVAGMHYVKVFSGKQGRTFICRRIYCTLVGLLVTVQLARSCFLYEFYDNFCTGLLRDLLLVVWEVHCCVNVWALHWACATESALPKFVCTFDQVNAIDRESRLSYLRKRSWVLVVIACTATAINTVFLAVAISNDWFQVWLYPLNSIHPAANAMRAYSGIVAIYMTMAWVYPLVFTYAICSTLAHEFLCIANRLKQVVESELSAHCLQKLRIEHQKICDMVDSADELLSLTFAGTFFWSLVQTFTGVYIQIAELYHSGTNFYFALATAFWTLSAVVAILILICTASNVHKQVLDEVKPLGSDWNPNTIRLSFLLNWMTCVVFVCVYWYKIPKKPPASLTV